MLNTGFRKKSSIVKISIADTRTSGFRQNSDYQRQNGQIVFRRHFGAHALFLLSHFIRLRSEIPSSLNLQNFQQSPQKAAANWLKVQGFEKYQKWLSGLTLQSDFSEHIRNKLSFFLNHNNAYESRPFNILDDQMLTYGVRDECSFHLKSARLTLGAEIFRETYQWQLKETINGNEGSTFANNKEHRNFLNIFTKVDFDLGEKWEFSTGANLHFLSFNLSDQFPDNKNLSGSYSYAPVFSPRIGISGNILSSSSLFASVGHGFSAPSVEETLLPEGSVNHNLKPEEGINYDLGLRGQLLGQRINYDITGYFISVKNLLVTKRESEDVFYGINAGKTRHYGVESMIKANLTDVNSSANIILSVSHTLMRNQFKDFTDDGVDFSNNQLPGIPNHFLRSSLKARFNRKTQIQLIWKNAGSMYLNDSNTKTYNGYHIFNLKAAQRFFSGKKVKIDLQGGIQNLFDVNYAPMVVVNAPSFGGSAPRYYYPGAPRNSWLRLRLTFKN